MLLGCLRWTSGSSIAAELSSTDWSPTEPKFEHKKAARNVSGGLNCSSAACLLTFSGKRQTLRTAHSVIEQLIRGVLGAYNTGREIHRQSAGYSRLQRVIRVVAARWAVAVVVGEIGTVRARHLRADEEYV